jgi:hypothetical protein
MQSRLEAVIDRQGNVRLIQPITLPEARRALVIILDKPVPDVVESTSSGGQAPPAKPALPPKYTKKQGQYLAYIHAYTRVYGYPPAESDMQEYFQTTPPSVHQMVVRLTDKRLIARKPGEPRTIKVLLPPEQLPELERP